MSGGSYPAPGSAITRADYDDMLATLGTWINDRGERLVQLDERAGASAVASDRSDVALAFVLWQAIGERRDELTAVAWPDRDRPTVAVADLVWRPLVDRTDTPLASNLSEAVALVDELARRVGASLDAGEQGRVEDHRRRREIEADLVVAERLAPQLGEQVRATADARRDLERLSAASVDPATAPLASDGYDELAATARRLRVDLEASDAERTAALAACASATEQLDRLRAREAEAQALAADCRERFADPPRLAVPSVDAVEPPPADLADRPWPQARPLAQEFVRKVERVGQALDMVMAAYAAPRRERDDLRGLLQAYRDKADSLGVAEDADIDAAYRRARDVLWTAPCDLVSARERCDTYQRAVRSMVVTPEEAT